MGNFIEYNLNDMFLDCFYSIAIDAINPEGKMRAIDSSDRLDLEKCKQWYKIIDSFISIKLNL